MKRTGCGAILLLLLCLPVLGYAAQETLFADGEPPKDWQAMRALEGTQWQIAAGGSMYADLQCFLSDGEVLCDWDGWEESHPGEARIAAYSVSRYDSAWNLFWRDVPYMITYIDLDGDKHRYGLEFDADELNLVTGEGGGGFIPYRGDGNCMVDGLIEARLKQGPRLDDSASERMAYYAREDMREGTAAVHYAQQDGDDYTSVFLYFDEEHGVWFPGQVAGGKLYDLLPNAISDGGEHVVGRNDAFHYGDHPWKDAAGLDVTTIPLSAQEALSQMDQSEWAVVNNPNPEDRLHLRAKPDRKSESLGKFYNRTPVRVLEARGEWVLVTVGGTGMMEGWMMKKYLAFGDAMADVACAFPQMQHIALYRETGVPVEYIPKVTDQRPAFIDEGDAYIVGVYGDEWYILYDPASGRVGYALQSLFCAGNG